MPEKRSYTYEAMFLIGQAAATDLAGVIEHIKEIMVRGHAEIIAMRKWDERRLAYEIKKQKRGLYILCYFKAPGDDMTHIDRDCNLSEKILRALILRADHLTLDEILAADARTELDIEAKLRAKAALEGPADGASAVVAAPAPVAAAVEADAEQV